MSAHLGKPTQMRRAAALAMAAALALSGCAGGGGAGGAPGQAPQTVAARSVSEQRLGDREHPKIVEAYGGVYGDARVTAYVNQIGAQLAAQSEQPQGPWTFTVLDSPVVNAFALPGGYVYVTRGLIALSNDEAELAGVIGHEIGHVTGAHTAQRQERGSVAQIGVLAATLGAALLGASSDVVNAVGQLSGAAAQGYVASFTRDQEFAADKLGVRYIARAGYDPFAQADFLSSLQAQSELSARLAGGAYDPNRVDFFASHPATAQRVRQAIGEAQAAGLAVDAGAPRNKERFNAIINGMVYGDSAAQGFVRGSTFSHPGLKLSFSAPAGYQIANAATRVTASGPNGAGLSFTGGRDSGGPLDAYIARVWAQEIARQTQVGQMQGLERTTINGLEAATGFLPVATQSGTKIFQLTAIRHGGAIYRLTGVFANNDRAAQRALDAAARSFRPLSNREASQLRPYRITIHTVRPGETAASLAARTPFDREREARFRVLNGLAPGEALRPGTTVKLVAG